MLQAEPQLLLNSGTLVGKRYEILEALGAGGMGWVFRCRDTRLEGQEVALKFLYPHLVSDEHALSRFRNEVLVARRLIHPAIVRTFTFESDQQHAYIVMEYVEGATLRERLTNSHPRGMSPERGVAIALDIAIAMHHSHISGVIHRDLKPDNVMLSVTNEVKVSDFGLASLMRAQGQHTRSGQLLGTPYYMAPEQFRGETLDARADIYAFGILLYELLFGVVPFNDVSLYALAKKHERDEIEPPMGREPLQPPLWAIIKRATEKLPAERYASFEEVVRDLEAIAPAPSKLGLTTAPATPAAAEEPTEIRWKPLSWRFLILEMLVVSLFFVYWTRTNSTVRATVAIPILKLEQRLGIRLNLIRRVLAVKMELYSNSLAEEYDRGSIGFQSRLWAGENPNAQSNRNSRGQYALHVTARNSDIAALNMLLASGADPDLPAFDGTTALHEAVENHAAPAVEALLKGGANPNVIATNSLTPLLRAVQTGDSKIAKLLIAAGADPLSRSEEGRSALMHAAAAGNSGVVEAALAALPPAALFELAPEAAEPAVQSLTSIVGLK